MAVAWLKTLADRITPLAAEKEGAEAAEREATEADEKALPGKLLKLGFAQDDPALPGRPGHWTHNLTARSCYRWALALDRADTSDKFEQLLREQKGLPNTSDWSAEWRVAHLSSLGLTSRFRSHSSKPASSSQAPAQHDLQPENAEASVVPNPSAEGLDEDAELKAALEESRTPIQLSTEQIASLARDKEKASSMAAAEALSVEPTAAAVEAAAAAAAQQLLHQRSLRCQALQQKEFRDKMAAQQEGLQQKRLQLIQQKEKPAPSAPAAPSASGATTPPAAATSTAAVSATSTPAAAAGTIAAPTQRAKALPVASSIAASGSFPVDRVVPAWPISRSFPPEPPNARIPGAHHGFEESLLADIDLWRRELSGPADVLEELFLPAWRAQEEGATSERLLCSLCMKEAWKSHLLSVKHYRRVCKAAQQSNTDRHPLCQSFVLQSGSVSWNHLTGLLEPFAAYQQRQAATTETSAIPAAISGQAKAADTSFAGGFASTAPINKWSKPLPGDHGPLPPWLGSASNILNIEAINREVELVTALWEVEIGPSLETEKAAKLAAARAKQPLTPPRRLCPTTPPGLLLATEPPPSLPVAPAERHSNTTADSRDDGAQGSTVFLRSRLDAAKRKLALQTHQHVFSDDEERDLVQASQQRLESVRARHRDAQRLRTAGEACAAAEASAATASTVTAADRAVLGEPLAGWYGSLSDDRVRPSLAPHLRADFIAPECSKPKRRRRRRRPPTKSESTVEEVSDATVPEDSDATVEEDATDAKILAILNANRRASEADQCSPTSVAEIEETVEAVEAVKAEEAVGADSTVPTSEAVLRVYTHERRMRKRYRRDGVISTVKTTIVTTATAAS
jgi:hypothetical protein